VEIDVAGLALDGVSHPQKALGPRVDVKHGPGFAVEMGVEVQADAADVLDPLGQRPRKPDVAPGEEDIGGVRVTGAAAELEGVAV